MPRRITIAALSVTMLAAVPRPAASHSYHIGLPARLHAHNHVNSVYGYMAGHSAAIPRQSSRYRNIEARCEGRSLGSDSTATTIGISQASHRNFFAECMTQAGAWQ
ncbi:hypothetical protein HNW77_01595 [Komagataeibacter sp. AV436]|uniref:UrcA family protein n=1 Tax=Komagataeibacter melomenusus TaxID=2766578 RepID=A0ABX2ABM2_9PROT|nr:hypothetical protein [Komagataeibacter melomenusus]MBV1829679.1 hypothetical protein [Komagataeibacter melomenusus]NPC65120.1 hypothetical protein [Komagataeibacter melomenusus]